MRKAEFYARLEAIEKVLDAVKEKPSEPARWEALIRIAYSELRWATKLMRHCATSFLDEDATVMAGKASDEMGQILARLKQLETRVEEVELSGTWSLPGKGVDAPKR